MAYDYSVIVDCLLDWYDLNARILPWREQPQAYRVWVSEIMLQQTRVEAVKPYFDRFIEALPDVESLAGAEEETLLKLWEGLGYYNRVKNMKKAAGIIMKDYGGIMPKDPEDLKKLPGIGPYTAGAVSSIAYAVPTPAVDGNVLRVCKRIAGSFDDITSQTVKRELEENLAGIMPESRAGDFNQSLMELGAVVCLPNGKPLCTKCPVMHLCKAFHDDTVMQIPVKKTKKERKTEDKTVFLLCFEGKYALHKRKDRGLLSGLWEFPNVPEKLKISQVREQFSDNYTNIVPLGSTKHIFSHLEWHMNGYKIMLKEKTDRTELIWASRQEIENTFPLPSAFSYFKTFIK